jgi:hypothetical protein
VSKNITTRTVQDGRDFVTSESHFDVDQLRNDQVYRDALAGKASNILAMEQDQVVKYVGNNLGWGDKITAETLYGKNITEDQRQAFIEEQLFEKDLRRLMPKYQTRQAKQSDVDAYNNDVNIAKDIEAGKTQPLQVGDTLYYNVTDTTSTKVETGNTATEPKAAKPASPEQRARERAEDIVNALLKNPASTVREKLGPEAEFSTEGNVITIVRESGPESFDMNRKEDIKNLARELDKYQYGADATTDITSMEIGKFIEERRKKRLP